MQEFMLFTRDFNDNFNLFQGDYGTAADVFEAARRQAEWDIYRIVSHSSLQVLAEGPISNLFAPAPNAVAPGGDWLISFPQPHPVGVAAEGKL